jgi:hypothetical protein
VTTTTALWPEVFGLAVNEPEYEVLKYVVERTELESIVALTVLCSELFWGAVKYDSEICSVGTFWVEQVNVTVSKCAEAMPATPTRAVARASNPAETSVTNRRRATGIPPFPYSRCDEFGDRQSGEYQDYGGVPA